MKITIKCIFIVLILMLCNVVEASDNVTLVSDVQENIFYTRRGGGKPYVSLPYKTFTINNRAVYCIEPGIEVITDLYIGSNDFINSPFSDDINKLIELIGYYGYDFPGHNTLKYRMATQALIWEKTGGQTIEFWTQRYGYGDYIDVSKEKNEIMKLVNNHEILPSFAEKQINIVLGNNITLKDENNNLEKFSIIDGNLNIKRNQNVLSINANLIGKYQVIFKKIKYDDERSIIYVGSDPKSQKMAFFRYSDDISTYMTVNVFGGELLLKKHDYDTKSNVVPSMEATLSGAIYGIYDEKDELYQKIETDNLGCAVLNNLPIGNYYLKEISPSLGYNLDLEKYYFTISKDNFKVEIKVYEKIIKKELTFIKYCETVNGLMEEDNIKFGVYNKNNELIQEFATNKDGMARITLNYGTYLIRQINSTNGYYKVDDLEIKVDNELSNLTYKLVDKPILIKTRIYKKDETTKKPILEEGVLFKVKNLTTNKEYCGFSGLTECTYETNNKGFFEVDLPYGTYYVEEIKAPKNYKLSVYKHLFLVDGGVRLVHGNDGIYLLVNFYNEPLKGTISIKKEGEEFNIKDNQINYNNISLSGVEFSLYASDDILSEDGNIKYKKGELIKKVETNEKGIVKFGDLNMGKYFVKESKTLYNYEIDKRNYEFVLNENSYNKDLIIYNKLVKANIKIIKKDNDTKEVIPNTLLALYNEDGNYLFDGYTNQDGIWQINNIPLGKYFIKEKSCVEGYILDDKMIEIVLKKTGEVFNIDVFNKKDKITVPDTASSTPLLIKVIIFIFILLGSGCIFLARHTND